MKSFSIYNNDLEDVKTERVVLLIVKINDTIVFTVVEDVFEDG